jgi:hypothetical protein
MLVRRSGRGLEIILLCLFLGASLAVAQDESQDDDGIRGVVIPLAYQEEQITALVQVIVDGFPSPNATWELKATPMMGCHKKQTASGRLAVAEAGTPAVFETMLNLIPGHYEIQLEAEETNSEQTFYAKLHGLLPDPNRKLITVEPIALMQPVEAVFLRDGAMRPQGALGRTEDEPVPADRPTAMISMICRWKGHMEMVRVERELSGSTSMAFDPIELDLSNERCVMIRDIIPQGVMTEGMFRYEVRVFDGEEQKASGYRLFDAVTE